MMISGENNKVAISVVVTVLLLSACGDQSAGEQELSQEQNLAAADRDLNAGLPSTSSSQDFLRAVISEGTGNTFDEALSQAILLAIGQVNGIEIQRTVDVTQIVESYNSSQSVSVEENSTGSAAAQLGNERFVVSGQSEAALNVDTGVNSSSTLDVGYQNNFSNIGGIIESFVVLERSDQNAGILGSAFGNGNSVNVRIEASIRAVEEATYQASAASQRLSVAAIPLRISQGALGSEQLGSLWSEEVNQGLAQTGRVAVMNRSYGDEILSELSLLQGPNAQKDQAAKLGNLIGADYLIVGTIQKAEAIRDVRTIALANRAIEGPTSYSVSISYSVIETATGVVAIASSFERQSVTGTTLEELVGEASQDVIDTVIEKLFPLRIERIVDGVFYFGQGADTVSVGEQYRVIRQGAEIIDSYTNEVLGTEEEDIGVVQVFEVLPNLSKARLIENDGVDRPDDLNGTSLVARKVDVLAQVTEPPTLVTRPEIGTPNNVDLGQPDPVPSAEPSTPERESLIDGIQGAY
jgi:hypothetical protein